MADLIVEDGTGKAGAESYNTVAELDAYHLRMGNAGWPQPGADPDPDLAKKEAAARRAAVFLDSRALLRVNGSKKNPDQGLLFPQAGATDFSGRSLDPDSVPALYKSAHCEAALLAFTGVQLAPEVPAGPLLKSKTVDVIGKEWFEGS